MLERWERGRFRMDFEEEMGNCFSRPLTCVYPTEKAKDTRDGVIRFLRRWREEFIHN